MSGIENLAIFIASSTSTLLGFVAIIYIFWISLERTWPEDKIKQNKDIFNSFKYSIIFAIGVICFSFITIVNSIREPNGSWESIFLYILMIMFIVFILLMALLISQILNKMIGKDQSEQKEKK